MRKQNKSKYEYKKNTGRIATVICIDRINQKKRKLAKVQCPAPNSSMIYWCRCDDLNSVPGELRVPAAMLSLDSLLGPSDWVDRWGLVLCSVLSSALQLCPG